MQWKNRKTVLNEAIDDWAARGLLPAGTAERLHEDTDAHQDGWSFRALIITFGVLCLILAAITFVAANWEEIPRLGRLGLIGGVLWLAWIGAIWAGRRGSLWWFEGLSLLACGLYGAAIMLVAQIYHIQGEPVDAVWLWAVGTLIAAAVTRTAMPLALAMALFFLWFTWELERDFAAINLVYLGWWAIGALLSALLPSRLNGHLAALALIAWAVISLAQEDMRTQPVMLVAGAAFAVVSLALASLAGQRWLRGFETSVVFYALALAGGLATWLHVETHDFIGRAGPPIGARPVLLLAPLACLAVALWGYMRGSETRYDLWVTAVAAAFFTVLFAVAPEPWITAAFVLALFVWVTRMGWRLSLRTLRVLGIAGFFIMLMIVYAETLGNLIGTAGFYLGAGLLLLLGALIAPRLARGTRS